MNERREASGSEPAGPSFFDLWQTWYEKTAEPFMNVPQFGLMRYYQEHLFQSMDKLFQLQASMTEFTRILLQPVEKSVLDAQNELFASFLTLAQNRPASEKKETKLLYANWIASMEKHYMELFRSPDFLKQLHNTMGSLNGFIIARQTVLEDLLKSVPVPTQSEMDGLYKEFHELKKKLRDLENRKDVT
jgi:hypothetical protein